MNEHPRLSEVIGQSFREWRRSRDLSLEEVAGAMRDLGYRWSVPRVVELEGGKVSPTIGLLVGLLHIMENEDERSIEIAELVPSGSYLVEIAPGVTVMGSNLRDFLAHATGSLITGSKVARHNELVDRLQTERAAHLRGGKWTEDLMARTLLLYGLADERAARSLKIPLGDFLTVATSLWGQSITEERNARAPEGASGQARGRVTRDLIKDAREYMSQVARA
ncbi:MAG: hypothetical protein HIU85_19755 [Proteobacteria bacterium]|nr:hypothetical protein [Pseudomonadota bacterium]